MKSRRPSRPCCRSLLACLIALAAIPCAAQSQSYTFDADFAQGTLLNVNYAAYPNQLQLEKSPQTFPFIWIAVSARGTAIKLHVSDGQILGDYATSPDGMARNPSRTTVDRHGNVWVGNRDEESNGLGSVIKIGTILGGTRGYPDTVDPSLFIVDPVGQYIKDPVYNQCVDRDDDGLIRTSRGYQDVLSWPQVTDGAGSVCDAVDPTARVEDAEDECILAYQRVHGTRVRHLSVDPDNNIWVGGYINQLFDLLENETACITRSETMGCGGYGGLNDCNGVFWSANPSQGLLLRYDPDTGQSDCLQISGSYGLGIDTKGYIWNTQYVLDSIAKLDPQGNVVFTKPVDPNGECQGISGNCGTAVVCPTGMAVRPEDNSVWTANRFCNYRGLGYASVSRLDNDGNIMKVIPLLDPTTGAQGFWPSGVAVDSTGMVWVNNIASSSIMRIDPNAGPDGLGEVNLTVELGDGANPYDYSDMSGITALGNPAYGFWDVVRDTGCDTTLWQQATWNTETPLPAGAVHEPAGTSIMVEIRVADTRAGLTRQNFMRVQNGVPFGPLPGRFLEVRVSFNMDTETYCDKYGTPVLTDLTVTAEIPVTAAAGPDQEVCRGGSVIIDGAGSGASYCAGVPEYRWSWPGYTGNWSPFPDNVVTPVQNTTYTLEVRCSTDPDCMAKDEVVVTVIEPPEARVRSMWRPCLRVPVALDASQSTSAGCSTGLSYRFHDSGGAVVRDWAPDPYYIFTPTVAGIYSFTVDVVCNDRPECMSTFPINVEAEECSQAVRYGWYQAQSGPDRSVRVRWQTLQEEGSLGFHVLRSDDAGGPEAVVSGSLVPAHGPGAPYELGDALPEGVDPRKVRYRIVEVTADGRGDSTDAFGITGGAASREIERSRRAAGARRAR